MYRAFYKLSAEPFRLSPDPRFCFEHRTYRKAMTYMRHGLHRAEGFIMITGRPGTGKTTLINDLLRTLKPDQVMVANLVTTQLTADNLLRLVAYSFNMDPEGADKVEVLMQVARFLKQQHQQGRRALLIVDEAQGMSEDALEELRQLTNIQVGNQQLLQIFLIGQEQLRDIVNIPSMEQLRQRMIAATHLEPLDRDDTEAYIKHRLRSVAWTGDPLISKEAYAMIQQYSQGIPRQINQICSRLLLHGTIEEKHRLGIADVEIVIEELRQESLMPMDTAAMAADLIWPVDQHSETYVEEPRRQTATAAPKRVQQPAPTAPPATQTRQQTEPVRLRSNTVVPATPPSMAGNKPAAKTAREPLTNTDPGAGTTQKRQQPTANTARQQQRTTARMTADLENTTRKTAPVSPGNRALNQTEPEEKKVWKRSSWALLGLAWLITGLALAMLYITNPELTRLTGKNLMTWAQSGIQKGVSFATGQSSPGVTKPTEVMGGAVVRETPPLNHEPKTGAAEIEITAQERNLDLPQAKPLQLAEELQQTGHPVERVDNDIIKVKLKETVVHESAPLIHEPKNDAADIVTAAQEADLPQAKPLQLAEELQQSGLLVERVDDDIIKVNLSGDGMFAFDSARIKDGARANDMVSLANVLRKHGELTIQVVGHSDSSGAAEYNLYLSRQRAKAVADFLVSQGLADSSIQSEGRGDHDTRLEQSTSNNSALKRRVDIYINQVRKK